MHKIFILTVFKSIAINQTFAIENFLEFKNKFEFLRKKDCKNGQN